MEAEIFAIRYSINQVTCILNINQIIVITDLLYIAKKTFDSLIHLYQIQSSLISRNFRDFFIKYWSNSIKFWNCPSHKSWTLHNLVDKEMKRFDLFSMFSSMFIKNKRSELNFFLFSFLILFYFWFIFLDSIFRTRVRVTKSHCHTSVMSHDTGKDIEGSERMMSYNVWYTCWL